MSEIEAANTSNSLPYNGKWPMGKKDKALADAACAVGWYRFAEVDKFVLNGHRLFRSSCPGYTGSDASQTMTPDRAKFLASKGIDSLISFNEEPYKKDQLEMLKKVGINYLHIKVKDFGVASDEDYDRSWRFFKANKVTLVHCGFGWGRTGTGICLLQLYSTRGDSPDEKLWGEVDGGDQVEKEGQKVALRRIKGNLRNGTITP
ncbi:hypothetical protein ONZ45_g1620 [Pleurotus djamor]|nr:hypothetical protein ONZ45_g1620 [Pleurotus djamor]